MKKTLFWVLAFCLVSLSFGRVGPVSQYGQLQAGKNSAGQGRIYGSCKGVSNGNEVQVQGMSLFWSIAGDVGDFWNSSTVTGLVQRQNIQLIRAAMGVDEDWGSGNYFTNQSKYQGMMDAVVQAAIDNDIYVIIDYHSHKASGDVNSAKSFFSRMAQKWGGYDNVIFEIFNEPTSQSWGTIKTYADEVVKTIRQYSDNLILVGSRNWDQFPNDAINNEVADSKHNIAYTFHYYAGSHSIDSEGSHAEEAMRNGLSVFVSEWGTVHSSGNNGFNSGNSQSWYNWMVENKLSGANWSVSNKGESASYFSGSPNEDGTNWNYTQSGSWVNEKIFSKLPKSYSACSTSPVPSSSSAEVPPSSSSTTVPPSSSSITVPPPSSSSITVKPSSSSISAPLVVTGKLQQTVERNKSISPVIFTNVNNYRRATYNAYYLNVTKSDNVVVVDGLVPSHASLGKVTEEISIDGTIYTIDITVVEATSSSSETPEESSSSTTESSPSQSSNSATVATNWEATNAHLQETDNGIEITNGDTWDAEREIVRTLGEVTAGETYTLSFDANLAHNTMDIQVALNNYCNEAVSLSSTDGASTYTCSFTASATEPVTITITVPGSRWEPLTISDMSLQSSNGEEIIVTPASSNSATEASSSSAGPEATSSNANTTNSSASTMNITANVSSLAVAVIDHTLYVAGVEKARVDVFDLQGRPVMGMSQVSGSVSLESLRQGSYIVRVRAGSMNYVRRISIK